MCTFCINLANKIQNGGFFVYKYHLKLNINGKIYYNSNQIYAYSKTNVIPWELICKARKQFESAGITGIDKWWFQNTFNKRLENSPCSLKFLKAIVQ